MHTRKLQSAAATALLTSVAADTTVVEVQWSNTVYGPDGPWHAASVFVGWNGTAGNNIDLYPGGAGSTEVFTPGYCARSLGNSNDPDCGSAGTYNPSLSKTGRPSPINTTASLPLNLGINESFFGGNLYYDLVYFNASGQFNLSNNGLPVQADESNLIIGITAATQTYPNGATTVPEVGLLDIGGLEDAGFTGSDTITTALLRNGSTSSASFGLSVGSPDTGVVPSLTYGGYDQNKVLGDVLNNPGPSVSRNYNRFQLGISSLSLNTSGGISPFTNGNQGNILAANNASLSTGVVVTLQPGSPYMGLPKSTCDYIATQLPLIYDEGLNLYFWNTSNPAYDQIVSSQSFLSFGLTSQSSSESITINVPLLLLNLTLDSKDLTQTPTPYFPCAPINGGGGYLGRAFLQAAFLGANWKPFDPPGAWWVAQAPGPVVQTSDIVKIGSNDLTIQASTTSFEASWAGHWVAVQSYTGGNPNGNLTAGLTNSASGSSGSSSSSSGLSSGAKVGLGVGLGVGIPLILALILIPLFMRRRKQKAYAKPGELNGENSLSPGSNGPPGSTGFVDNKAELSGQSHPPMGEKHMIDGSQQPSEMDDALGGSANPAEVDDSVGGSANLAEVVGEAPIQELPEDREYYNGMPVRQVGDPAERIEIGS